jgi:hypothetical protein
MKDNRGNLKAKHDNFKRCKKDDTECLSDYLGSDMSKERHVVTRGNTPQGSSVESGPVKNFCNTDSCNLYGDNWTFGTKCSRDMQTACPLKRNRYCDLKSVVLVTDLCSELSIPFKENETKRLTHLNVCYINSGEPHPRPKRCRKRTPWKDQMKKHGWQCDDSDDYTSDCSSDSDSEDEYSETIVIYQHCDTYKHRFPLCADDPRYSGYIAQEAEDALDSTDSCETSLEKMPKIRVGEYKKVGTFQAELGDNCQYYSACINLEHCNTKGAFIFRSLKESENDTEDSGIQIINVRCFSDPPQK